MADDIYDYFSGNAPKKVEPIEDDDLDVVDEGQPSEEKVAAAPEEASLSAETTSNQAEVVVERSTPESTEDPVSEPLRGKDSSHWDSLASELGLEPATPLAPPAISSVDSNTERPAASTSKMEKGASPLSVKREPEVTPASPEPVAESKVELQTKTEPESHSSDDFFGFDPIPPAEEESVLSTLFTPLEDADPFEALKTEAPVESEDSTESGDETVFDSDEQIDESGEEYLEFEIEDLDDSPYAEGEEAEFGRRARRRQREEKIEDDPPQARRGRHRRAKTEEDSGPEPSPPRTTSIESIAAEPASTSPDYVVDEIGWAVPVESGGQDNPVDDEPEVEAASQSDDETLEPRSRRRRRRGRGRDRDRQDSDRTAPTESRKSSDDFEDDVVVDELQETEDRPSRDRSSRGRRPARSSQRRETAQEESDFDGKRSKFPTWEEAIAGLIDSNIKNHSKGNRGRGGSGRGRGRGRGRSDRR